MTDSARKVNAPAPQGENALAAMVRDSMGVTMTSKQVAEIIKKDHSSVVVRDIKNLLKRHPANLQDYVFKEIKSTYNGREVTSYFEMNFKALMLLTTGYDAAKRAAVIDRWYDLEQGEAQPIAPPAPAPAPMQVMPAINVQDLATAVATAVVFALKAVKDGAPAPAAPPAPVDDFGIDPRQEYSISEVAAILGIYPAALRETLKKDNAINLVGERAWTPSPALESKAYCVFVPSIGWKFTRLGAVRIVRHYGAKLVK